MMSFILEDFEVVNKLIIKYLSAISHCWYKRPRPRPFGLKGKIFLKVLHNKQLRAQDVKYPAEIKPDSES